VSENSESRYIYELTAEEAILIEAMRKDKLLRKAVLRYFEAMSGIDLKKCVENK